MNSPFVVTSGEPAGIGPDICLSIAKRKDNSDFVIFGNIDLLKQRAEILDLDPVSYTHLTLPTILLV